ncbi:MULTISPECIES: PDR/VanB family oxidoreductase [unclassified Burkholderia]|uniref:PDR/VanB family oxidoreductase n=1 Tax=unclassified Burkholderia TaxID=2613784 RepID=UPI002AB226BC|nr:MULTISPECIES: PDR/VanB family oxidoreductase [unclassified Burkholderia]
MLVQTVLPETSGSTQVLRVKVASRRREAINIDSFELTSLDGSALPPFSAGSHIDVRVSDGLVRQYSLCNAPSERHRYLIAVLKEENSRGGSRAMHEAIHIGDEITISRPRNHFELSASGLPTLLFAGGIGVTPILAMAERLYAAGADFQMYYCARSQERMAFYDRISESGFASRVLFHFDDGARTQKLDIAAVLDRIGAQQELYVCGPGGFMDAVLGQARARAWPEDRLHYEFFSAKPCNTDGDRAFEVHLARSGRLVVVGRDQTVAQALADAGVRIPLSCEQGVCGTCVTRVLEGIPAHKDVYLTPEEQAVNDRFTPCCSRANTARLVLDL